MLKLPFNLSQENISCLVWFTKDDEAWFGYGKVNNVMLFVVEVPPVLRTNNT